jgi:hypothetical protein
MAGSEVFRAEVYLAWYTSLISMFLRRDSEQLLEMFTSDYESIRFLQWTRCGSEAFVP